ncbi:hypothetical protein K432DRAFT_469233 [Lepidopterella palustris CBS 459.81]|uniref:Uncharacterized protein n=1 Tax=Lepidopterella palustris CBS 459.81 TaxID=1314670 RepID=A0A8E2DZF2_9PEZI|nr:hypothetical protein K432DRAFT_469233 [Lepidopterella palustris CBS 459.81]
MDIVDSEVGTDDPQKRSGWKRMIPRKEGKDWQKEFKTKDILAAKFEHDLQDIQNELKTTAASLHRNRESAFYDSIRNLEDTKLMIKALLTEYENALGEGKRLKDDCNNERRQRVDMLQQLREKGEEFDRRWRSKEIGLEREHQIKLQQQYAKGQRDETARWTVRLADVESRHKVATSDSEAKIRVWETEFGELCVLNKKIEAARDRLREEKEALEKEIEEAKAKYRSEVKELEISYCKKLSKVEKDIQDEKKRHAEIQKAHNSTMATMEEEYNSAIEQLKREHKSEEGKLRQTISALKQGHTAELERCEKRHNQEVSRLKSNFDQTVSQKQAAYAAAEKSLREEIAAYSGALLSRDKNDFNMVDRDVFEPMTDTDIEAKFVDLVQGVDWLSRLEWIPNPKGWTNQILRSLSSNQRLLKKQILQDSNNLDNSDYVWPKPGIETERWRYITIRECQAALRQPVPSEWDPRAKLKKGFQTSIEQLKKEIISTLGELTALDKNSLQALEKMVVRAARTWLQFGLQRCRILVVVQRSNLRTVEERVQKAREDGLELVMVPRLKRFGTSNGESLDIEETIADRDGETVKVGIEQRYESKAKLAGG